jgi:flagellar hook assembly protein FlgD
VDLRIYDVAGRLVKTVLAEEVTAGIHSATWDGTDRRGSAVASGVYFYKIVAGPNVSTKKMVLLR